MRLIALVLLFICLLQFLHAQKPGWDWLQGINETTSAINYLEGLTRESNCPDDGSGITCIEIN